MSKEAMKLALEHAQPSFAAPGWTLVRDEDITALREALAEQPAQQEPVAWMTKDGEIYKHECWPEYEAKPLVFGDTSPPTPSLAQRTWVGLTEVEADKIYKDGSTFGEMMRMVEAKLKEKNT